MISRAWDFLMTTLKAVVMLVAHHATYAAPPFTPSPSADGK